MDRRRVITSAVVVAAVGAAAALTLPALAETSPDADSGATAPRVSSKMFAALQRDLNLTAEQADARLTKEAWAIQTRKTLAQTLGTTYGGAWLNANATQLTVAVTNARSAAVVEAAGAEPKLVTRSARQLDAIKATLDRGASEAAATIPGWYVDPATNSVVVLSRTKSLSAVRSFLAASDVPAASVRVVTTKLAPKLLYAPADPSASESAPPADGLVVRGGDPYFIDNVARCSVGFSVEGGFVSAGHCGQEGSTTTGLDGDQEVAQGTFQASTFPESDFSFVETNDDWTPVGEVNSFGGEQASAAGQNAAASSTLSQRRASNRFTHRQRSSASSSAAAPATTPPDDGGDGILPVAGSEEAPIGTSVCKFGSTTGASCGVVQALNVTVQFADPEGGPDPVIVNGLIQTDVCAEPGDSGGSLLAGDQAQGTVSGGSGDCTVGGQTFFQPVNEALETLNLTLLTTA